MYWGTLDAIGKILPAVMLVITITILRGLINKVDRSVITSRERLMTLHTVTFLCFILGVIGVKVSNFIRVSSIDKDADTEEKL